MSEIDFSLSFKNLNDIPFHKYHKDFTFVVNGKEYKTPRIVADILSPIIRKLHFIDESINEFNINTSNINPNDKHNDYFDQFLDLCSLEKVKLDSDVQTIFSTYFFKLGNFDEFLKINPNYYSDLSTDNALDKLESIIQLSENNFYGNITQIKFFDEIVSFISNHFEEIDKERLKKVPLDIIEEVLENDKMKIKDEDSLLKFVLELYKIDHSYSILFECIQFTNVCEKSLEAFINDFDIQYLNSKIWSRICSRLIQSKSERFDKEQPNKYSNQYKEFKYEKGKEFDGIMNYLIKQTGGNINDNGTIEITSNSIHAPEYHPKNVVDYDQDTCYDSKDYVNDSFICFDFKNKKVQLSDYSIKSSRSYNAFLKNWVIEASNDGQNFTEIDRRSDNSQLNGLDFFATFSIQNKNNEFYRFVRLRNTGVSWKNSFSCRYKVFIHSIEFFGKLQ